MLLAGCWFREDRHQMITELTIDSLLNLIFKEHCAEAFMTITSTKEIQVTAAISKRRELDIKYLGEPPSYDRHLPEQARI